MGYFKIGVSIGKLYPELAEQGGLSTALNEVFRNIGSSFKTAANDNELFNSTVYARVEKNNKFSQVYISSETKCYLPDYWRDGVFLANGATADIHLLAAGLKDGDGYIKVISSWECIVTSDQQLLFQFLFVGTEFTIDLINPDTQSR